LKRRRVQMMEHAMVQKNRDWRETDAHSAAGCDLVRP
jgi:hypothetical protein